MSEKPTVIVIRETLVQSIASDAFTFAMLAGLIGLGVFLDSTALQWVGGLMAMIGIVAKTTGPKKMTVAEARAKLDEIEGRA